jgi:hypothetical protein
MANMIPISTVTVGSGGASTIEFNNIPQIYTDLLIKISARTTATNGSYITMSFNSSTSSFTNRTLYASGGSTGSFTVPVRFGGYINNSGTTSSTFSNTEIYIPNYTSSNNKSFSDDGVSETNGTAAELSISGGLWSNTSPISSVQLGVGDAGNYAQYSSATLYGIRKY